MKQAERSADTRRRLLEAAVEVFAEDGFRNATIERICRRARANIAAAHYYFGDKQGLYTAVFEYAEQQRVQQDAILGDGNGMPPEERLRAYVAAFLSRLLDPQRPAWLARLLARELIEPTPALDRLVSRRMRANHEQLASIIRELVGPAVSDDVIRLCTLSVISQCVFYRNSAAIVARLYPELVPATEVQRIADHVAEFSLAAIRGLREASRDAEERHVS
jgi:AcrR family transcriptional regulator